MPIHEFNCPACEKNFEELTFGDAVPPCPHCDNQETQKLISCAAFKMPEISRVGQTVRFPKASNSKCNGCAGGSCSTCL